MRQVWKSTVMNIIYALIIYMVAGILTGVAALFTAGSALLGSSSGATGFLALTIVALLAMIGGFVWFFIGLSKFITLQRTEADRSAVSMVRTSYIVLIAGAILGLIPLIGWIITLLCGIAAYIMLIIAFGNFSKSEFMNENGRAGASLLKVFGIIMLVCTVLAIIPFVNILAILGEIAGIILLFLGWSRISNGCPREDEF